MCAYEYLANTIFQVVMSLLRISRIGSGVFNRVDKITMFTHTSICYNNICIGVPIVIAKGIYI